MTTNDEVILALYNYLAGAALVAVADTNGGLDSTVFADFDQGTNGGNVVNDADLQVVMKLEAADASYLYIRESGASTVTTRTLPTATLAESAPQAPAGRTMFLAAQMKPQSDQVDYFGSGQTVVEDGKKILRGVVMLSLIHISEPTRP